MSTTTKTTTSDQSLSLSIVPHNHHHRDMYVMGRKKGKEEQTKNMRVLNKKNRTNLLINLRFSHIVNLFGGLGEEKDITEQNLCMELDRYILPTKTFTEQVQWFTLNTSKNIEHSTFTQEDTFYIIHFQLNFATFALRHSQQCTSFF